ncbi:hypothetical protein ACS0TY_013819 [Phlomoides rotata]
MNRIRKTSVDLSSLIVNGELTFNPGIIADLVVQFYTELFTAQDQTTYDDSFLGAFIHPIVDATENDTLIALPSVEEIRRAVFDMEPSSSLGPDGFGGSFYQACWNIISIDVIEVVRRLHDVLSAYGGLSGQIYNPAKSTVYYGTAVTRHVRRMMLRIKDISHGSLSFSYLGVPLFKGASRTGHLAALADSIISKFSKWKGHSLSLAGRKCLINSVIAASLVHSMMIYYWPRTLLKKIEDAMRNFFWKGDISRRNTSCSVFWARVCSPMDEGGLGVRSIHLANDSFVYKLAWDILCNRSTDMTLLHDSTSLQEASLVIQVVLLLLDWAFVVTWAGWLPTLDGLWDIIQGSVSGMITGYDTSSRRGLAFLIPLLWV